VTALAPADLDEASWVDVCSSGDLLPELGVAAWVEGVQIALFRTFDGATYAVDNWDPTSKASVLARGIVGSHGEVPTLASPMYKHVFDLRTGRCLDDPTLSVRTHGVRVRDGRVYVAVRRDHASA
jgi:nitrite reductase (NADH) small subunit